MSNPYESENVEFLNRRLNKLLVELSEHSKIVSPLLVKMSHVRKEIDVIVTELKNREEQLKKDGSV